MWVCSLSHRERVGVRGYGVQRSAGAPSILETPHPPTASRRAPPSPSGRGILSAAPSSPPTAPTAFLPPPWRS
ncbi:hypothetical protein [Caulobacter sp. X]|uniref:hypothetical protein n=1 Tax=Caulobacter sp. X TaxID=2048901 RepID=UPI00350FB5DC